MMSGVLRVTVMRLRHVVGRRRLMAVRWAMSIADMMPAVSVSALTAIAMRMTAVRVADLTEKTQRGHAHHADETKIQAEPVSVHNIVMPKLVAFITHYIKKELRA